MAGKTWLLDLYYWRKLKEEVRIKEERELKEEKTNNQTWCKKI